jgi:hypothetical protein
MKEIKKIFFINQYDKEEFLHGGIGYTDIEIILASKKYTAITFPYNQSFSMKAKIGRIRYFFKCIYEVPKGAVVIFLYPAYAKLTRLLLSVLARKGVKVVCVVMDINGLKDEDPLQLKKDLSLFSSYNYFVVHNEKMRNWLNLQLHGKQSVCLEFFDFLTKPVQRSRELSYNIVFAGNLAKSTFLLQLHTLHDKSSLLHFNLYGKGFDAQLNEQINVSWLGVEKPYDVAENLKGSFGLVWDGESIEKPCGSLGNYMQYITHHKLSLYIVSGLPVIVPAFAASAYLVEKYRIGFLINSLDEIQEKIAALTPADYRELCENTKPLAAKITTGGCIKEALEMLLPVI